MAADELAGGPYIPLGGDLSGGDCGGGGGGFAGHCLEYCESPTAHCNVLNPREQVQRLDGILSETIPIHGRGNFPTLELQPSSIVKGGAAAAGREAHRRPRRAPQRLGRQPRPAPGQRPGATKTWTSSSAPTCVGKRSFRL